MKSKPISKQEGLTYQERQLKECTFRPRVNKSQNGQRRTLKEFLVSQQNFSKKVQQKRTHQKSEQEQVSVEETFHPKIYNKNHVNSILPKEQIFERLYKQRKDNKQNIQAPSKHPKLNFTPSITARSKNIIRDMPVTQHLYNDAIRRNELKEKSLYQSRPEESRQPNLANQKYAAQKFIKDYYVVLEDMSLT